MRQQGRKGPPASVHPDDAPWRRRLSTKRLVAFIKENREHEDLRVAPAVHSSYRPGLRSAQNRGKAVDAARRACRPPYEISR